MKAGNYFCFHHELSNGSDVELLLTLRLMLCQEDRVESLFSLPPLYPLLEFLVPHNLSGNLLDSGVTAEDGTCYCINCAYVLLHLSVDQ